MAKRWSVGEMHEYANGLQMKVVSIDFDSGLTLVERYEGGKPLPEYAVACQDTDCDEDEDVWCFVHEDDPWQHIIDALAQMDVAIRENEPT